MQDKIIDTLKVVKDPPSRAQVSAAPAEADKKGLPQSVTPMSDVIIDSLKMGQNPPSRAQVAQKDNKTDKLSKGNSLTQLSTSSKDNGMPQSGTPMSDVIIDVLKKVSGRGDGSQTMQTSEAGANDKKQSNQSENQNQNKETETQEHKAQLTAEEKRDQYMQSADKYDKFDSGNSKIDHVGEIGDYLDED
jgi:hypothetical protein